MTTPWRRAMAEANAAPPPPPETRTPLSPINGRRRRLSTKGAPKPAAPKTRRKTAAARRRGSDADAARRARRRGDAGRRLRHAAAADARRRAAGVHALPRDWRGRRGRRARDRGGRPPRGAPPPRAKRPPRRSRASAATAQLLDALRDAHETRLEVARRRVKDLEFELQARKGRDEARSPEVQRQRERAEAFRQEADDAARSTPSGRPATPPTRSRRTRGEAFVADDVADAAAAAAAAAREARLWNAHAALVEKRDEEAKQLAELVDERDAYEAANRALATRVARLDKEAAERDAREREIADSPARGAQGATRAASARC